MTEIHEECGVFGIFSPERTDLAGQVFNALFALQHRGQESAGIAVNDDGVFSFCRDVGLVAEVFSPDRLESSRRWQYCCRSCAIQYYRDGQREKHTAALDKPL